MQCQFCAYEGARKEFVRNMESIQTTASGLKPRVCPQCKKENLFNWIEELDDVEKELKELCMEMDDHVRSGKIDISKLKEGVKEVNNLNIYLNAEWVNDFLSYIYQNIKRAQAKTGSS